MCLFLTKESFLLHCACISQTIAAFIDFGLETRQRCNNLVSPKNNTSEGSCLPAKSICLMANFPIYCTARPGYMFKINPTVNVTISNHVMAKQMRLH
jgi:hypothetical protein